MSLRPLHYHHSSAWKYEILTAPPSNRLPLNLEQAKKFLRIVGDDDDEILEILIRSAASLFEKMTDITLLTTQFRTTRDNFYNTWELRKTPFQSLDRIQYEKDGSLTDFDLANVKIHVKQPYVDIHPSENATLAIVTDEEVSSVLIDFTAGYGLKPKDIPAKIQHILMQLTTFFYENRGDCGEEALPSALKDMIKACRVRKIHADLR